MQKVILWPISILIVGVLVLSGCGARSATLTPMPVASGALVMASDARLLDDSGGAGAPAVGEMAPDFQYTLNDGSVHTLSDLRGKMVLLNFWATWCAPCREEMPDLQRAQDVYRDSLVVLGINKLETADVIPAFAQELGVSFLLIANPMGDVSARYDTKNIPTSYFINRDGTIGFHKLGVMTYDGMQAQIERLH